MAAELGEWFVGDVDRAQTRMHRAGLRGEGYGVFWHGVGDAKGRLFVQVTGSAWQQLSEADARSLLAVLDGHGLKASRLDLCRDLTDLRLATAREMVIGGRLISHCGRVVWHEGLRGPDGRTLEIGTRESDRFLRIYDRRGPTRVEVELKRGRAAEAVAAVMGGSTFREAWRAAVDGLATFRGWPEWAEALA